MKKPLFVPSSNEKPELLTISFEDDPQGSLGAQLINCDKVRDRLQYCIRCLQIIQDEKFIPKQPLIFCFTSFCLNSDLDMKG